MPPLPTHSDTPRRRVTVEGNVHTDGDTIYVAGQNLATILRAAIPEDELSDPPNTAHGHLSITVEQRRV